MLHTVLSCLCKLILIVMLIIYCHFEISHSFIVGSDLLHTSVQQITDSVKVMYNTVSMLIITFSYVCMCRRKVKQQAVVVVKIMAQTQMKATIKTRMQRRRKTVVLCVARRLASRDLNVVAEASTVLYIDTRINTTVHLIIVSLVPRRFVVTILSLLERKYRKFKSPYINVHSFFAIDKKEIVLEFAHQTFLVTSHPNYNNYT